MSTWRTKYIADRLARRTFIKYHGYPPDQIPEKERNCWGPSGVEGTLGVYRKTRKPCSCMMCGNPRKYFGNAASTKTKQEKFADMKMKDEY